MKTKLAVPSVLGAVVLIMIAASQVSAQTCNAFHPVVPDGRVSNLYSSSSSTDHISFFFRGRPGRSYSVQVTNAARDYLAGNFSVNINTSDCPTTNMAGLTNTSSIDPTPQVSGDNVRFSFTAGTDAFYQFRVGSTSGSVSVEVTVSETTQFNPGWSTGAGGNFQTFYSIQNTTNASCTVTLTLVNNAGTTVGTTTQAIAAGALLGTNTTALGVPAGQSGIGTLTHNCPPGGIFTDAAIVNFSTSPAAVIPSKFLPVRESTH